MNLTTSAMGTAVGLSTDLSTGVIDRFRTLPMARSAILVGRTFSDLLAEHPVRHHRADHRLRHRLAPRQRRCVGVLAGLGVAVLFAYALSWFTACIGLLVERPESAQAIGLIILFPLAFVSNGFVPTQGLPAWLRPIADWNPVSAVAGACRELFGNPNPSALMHTFPSQHPVLVAILWIAAILAVCVPLASRMLRARTVD